MEATGTLSGIYSLLLQDEKIEITFPSYAAVVKFRIALSKYKKIQDEQMIGIDFIQEDERQMLCFRRISEEIYTYRINFAPKPDKTVFQFKILDKTAE